MKIFILFLAFIFISFKALAFDHSHKNWDQILKTKTKVVNSQTLVDYRSIKMDSSALKTYLKELQAVTKKDFKNFSDDQKLAYWINAYNAFTVKWIVDHYPVKSIKDTGSIFSSPWSKDFIKLMGKKMTLDNIEHDTIRVDFKEARIHFAVNCASIGCPSLYREAFVATKLEEQLEAATVHFMKNTNKNHKKGKTIYISKIFDWYGEDFEKYHKSVRNFVNKYIPHDQDKAKVKFLDYDWKLNDY